MRRRKTITNTISTMANRIAKTIITVDEPASREGGGSDVFGGILSLIITHSVRTRGFADGSPKINATARPFVVDGSVVPLFRSIIPVADVSESNVANL